MFYGSRWKKKLFNPSRNPNRGRQNLPYQRFQRTSAQLQLAATGEVTNGRVFLHDLGEEGVSIFLTAPVKRGAEVYLVINQPKHLFVRGEVAWCGIYRLNTRVISAENYQYRANIRFRFETAEERELITRYFASL